MQSEDPNYHYYRAEEELELAQLAQHPAAVKAHYLLAGRYLDTFYAGPHAVAAADAAADAADDPAAPLNPPRAPAP